MTNFIEELFHGNIEPQARSTKHNPTVQKQMDILVTNEDMLTEALSEDIKELFLDYVNAWGIVNGQSILDSFITGFCLGAQFAYDTFVSNNAPYQNLLKE